MEQKKRKLGSVLDALIDKDGIKTEVTITLTNQTLFKIIGGLLLSGVAIIVIANLLKNVFPNLQLAAIQKEVEQIKTRLN